MSEKELSVGFVGAGSVNFGGPIGPWDHASRLENIESVNIRVIAIVDPIREKAESVLEARKQGNHGDRYSTCQVYESVQQCLGQCKPDVMFVGTYPCTRGSTARGRAMEVEILRAGVHLFVEKPLSVTPPEAFSPYSSMVREAQETAGTTVSVGYMMR